MKPTSIEYGPLDDRDIYCDLVFDGEYYTNPDGIACAKRRRIVAPSTEQKALEEIFGRPEYPLTERLVELCRGHAVLDIGAHVGSAAAYFDELLSPRKIVCYEPNPIAMDYLCKNLGGFTEGEFYQKAVSNAAGISQFFVRVPLFTSGQFENDQAREVFEVETVTGIEAIESCPGEIGVLKVDCEAAEHNIIYSLRSQLDRVRVVFVEYHNEDIRRMLDQVLRRFQLFYAHTCPDAWWGQGTLGYVHKQFLSELK